MGRHAYDHDGNPVYEVLGKNGKVRDVNIKDMRERELVPGQTEIIRERSRPAFDAWAKKQAILSALTLPRGEDELADDFAYRALKDSEQQGIAARDKGIAIHTALESALKGETYATEYAMEVGNALKLMFEWSALSTNWVAEKGVAHRKGYGTRIDAFHPAGFVVDFKTKDYGATDKKGKPTEAKNLAYDEHAEQLIAGGFALNDMNLMWVEAPGARYANIFISTREPGLVMLHEHNSSALSWAWTAFNGRLLAWQGSNKYDSSFKR